MRLRHVALALALAFGVAATVEAKTKPVSAFSKQKKVKRVKPRKVKPPKVKHHA